MSHQKAKSYQDFVDALRSTFTKLELILDGIPCVRIKDPEAKRLLVNQYDRNGNGEVDESEAEAVNELASIFSGNTIIQDLSCLKYFSNAIVKYIAAFSDCTSLQVVELPDTSWQTYKLFNGCISLQHVLLPSNLTLLGSQCFYNCTSLKEIILPKTLTEISAGAFNFSGIERLVIPSLVTAAGDFKDMLNLIYVDLGESVISFSIQAFNGCTKLQTMIIRATTPPAWAYNMMNGIFPTIYVPDSCVNAYKTASGWSSKAMYIKPISEYKG